MRTRDVSTICGLCAIAALVVAVAPAWAQEPDERFRRLDRNGDGKLSRDELPEAVRANFDRIDTNGDGSISPAENAAFLRGRAGLGKAAQAGFRVPDTMQHIADVPYAATDNPRQQLDLLLPKEKKGNGRLPVVVLIHGGAWMGGDRKSGLPMLAAVVAGGEYAGVTVGYRLSGEATWPAQIHDCKAAIRWVRANASQYQLDPDKIGVAGGSAGGHLVAMLGTTGDDPSLEGTLGKHLGISTKVQCVVDQFGPSDLLTIGKAPSSIKHDAPDSPESRLLGGPVQSKPDAARDASPVTHVSADDPPFLVIHGTSDNVVPFDQSKRMVDALRKAGVSTVFIPVAGGGHGNFRTPEVARRVRLFFDKHLRGKDVTVPDDAIPAGQETPKPKPKAEAPTP
jgi:acetyl esterase/lipase